MRQRALQLVMVTAVLIASGPACADTVYLRNGQSIWGSEVLEDGADVVIVRPSGTTRVPKVQVDRVQRVKSSLPPHYLVPAEPAPSPAAPAVAAPNAPASAPASPSPAAPETTEPAPAEPTRPPGGSATAGPAAGAARRSSPPPAAATKGAPDAGAPGRGPEREERRAE